MRGFTCSPPHRNFLTAATFFNCWSKCWEMRWERLVMKVLTDWAAAAAAAAGAAGAAGAGGTERRNDPCEGTGDAAADCRLDPQMGGLHNVRRTFHTADRERLKWARRRQERSCGACHLRQGETELHCQWGFLWRSPALTELDDRLLQFKYSNTCHKDISQLWGLNQINDAAPKTHKTTAKCCNRKMPQTKKRCRTKTTQTPKHMQERNAAYWANTMEVLIFLNCSCYVIVKDYNQIFKPRTFLCRLSKSFTPLSSGTM